MKPQHLIPLYFALLCNTAFAQTAPTYWCNAPWPPPVGSDRTIGKDSDGHTCIKIAKPLETVPTAPPTAAKPETTIVPKEGAIAQPAKDLLRSQGNLEGISVTLSTNDRNEPVLTAICPKTDGLTKYDYEMYQHGYKQKAREIGGQLWIYYEK